MIWWPGQAREEMTGRRVNESRFLPAEWDPRWAEEGLYDEEVGPRPVTGRHPCQESPDIEALVEAISRAQDARAYARTVPARLQAWHEDDNRAKALKAPGWDWKEQWQSW